MIRGKYCLESGSWAASLQRKMSPRPGMSSDHLRKLPLRFNPPNSPWKEHPSFDVQRLRETNILPLARQPGGPRSSQAIWLQQEKLPSAPTKVLPTGMVSVAREKGLSFTFLSQIKGHR